MPAPTREIFEAGEDALCDAIVAVLVAGSVPAKQEGARVALPIPRVDVFVSGSTPTEQTAVVPASSPAKYYCSARRGTVSIRLVTKRGHATTPAALAGKCRKLLSSDKELITSANLPYHELLEFEETSFAYLVGEEKGTDEHLLTYSYVLGYPPSQHPGAAA